MKTRNRSWNVTDSLTIEELADADLPESLQGLRIDSLDITFRSIGYFEPANMYGGPDGLGWPAEGDDERTIEFVKAETVDRTPVPLSNEQVSAVTSWPAFQKAVDDHELSYDCEEE